MSNPYTYKEPVKGKQGFFNRTSEFTRIASRIAADRPQSVSVVGGARSGKTSIINMLCDPESQSEYLDNPNQYLILHLALRERPPANPEIFFAQLAEAVAASGRESMEPNYEGFNNLVVKRLMPGDIKLVIFLDDFALVTQNSEFPLDFFSFMRSVANSNDVGYVTTSHAPLQELCYNKGIEESPFFNIFTTVNLEPFKAEEARRLVEEPAQNAGQALGEGVEWSLELGGQFPYLLQVAAGHAFAAAGNGLDKDGLSSLAYKEVKPFLQELWENHWSEAEQEVLRTLCEGKDVERRHEYAAENLVKQSYLLRENNNYSIAAGLLERYVKEGGSRSFWKKLFG